jgi:SynChlorMet cassette radical SAM/SPASM protein ScmF
VKFNILQPTARGERMHFIGESLDIEELVDLGKWVENTLSAATGLNLYYDHPIAFQPLGKMFGQNGDGCGTCGIKSILGVLADGSYALCGIGEAVSELVFGHAGIDILEHVWTNTAILREIREELPHRLEGICGHCLMKEICSGSCLAQNYYRRKSLWEPFWFCDEAHRRGLFPETRIPPKIASTE